MRYYFYRLYLVMLIFIIIVSCQNKTTSNNMNPGSPEYKGKELFIRMACNACHSLDGSLKLGPTMMNQYGSEILHTDGSTMIIDDQYIKQSIIDPLKYIAEGYTPIMPSYKPVLSNEEIAFLIAYIKFLK